MFRFKKFHCRNYDESFRWCAEFLFYLFFFFFNIYRGLLRICSSSTYRHRHLLNIYTILFLSIPFVNLVSWQLHTWAAQSLSREHGTPEKEDNHRSIESTTKGNSNPKTIYSFYFFFVSVFPFPYTPTPPTKFFPFSNRYKRWRRKEIKIGFFFSLYRFFFLLLLLNKIRNRKRASRGRKYCFQRLFTDR